MNKINITFRINSSLLENIKQISREKSAKQKKDISYLDLIRESLEKDYSRK